MAKMKKTEKKIDTNAWMTTYTDLMILLLTFFVLLLSISVTDQKRKRLALNSLVGAFGFKPGGQAILGSPKGMNITVGTAPMEKEELMFEKLRNVALKSVMESEAELIKENDRTVIILSNQVLFDHNSDLIKSQYYPYLKELAKVLKDNAKLIELRGYVDPSEVTFDPDPLKRAMFISTRRALNVFRFLNEEGQIPANNIVAHGFGVNRSSKDKGGKESSLNRQVEIILDIKDEVPYRLKNKQSKGSWLDFKGFLFRYPGSRDE